MSSSNSKLPLLLFVAAPVAGHINPLFQVASHLVKRGYDVTFLATPEHKEQFAHAGVEWSNLNPLDYSKLAPARFAALNAKMPIQMFSFAFDNAFLTYIPERTQQLREALEKLRRREPERQIIIFHEVGAVAVHPFYYGAPIPEGYDTMPKTICLGINPLMFDSVVTGYQGPGLPFEDTAAARARNQYILDLVHTFALKGLAESHAAKLQEAGLCGPSFEYPDAARDTKIHFSGTLPSKPLHPDLVYPTWWSDVTSAAESGKKVVFLAQGSLEYPPEALMLPVIRALADEPDILLIVTVGVRGGSLPSEFQIPNHTRILDYFPYDAVLQYADIFIFNAGYGRSSHAVVNGVPMVVLGDLGQDKPEVAARIEWSGIGLAIRSPKPETNEIRTTVRKVLNDGKFKERVLTLQNESRDLDPLATIEKHIKELTA